jgi:hypothetical protein
LKIFIAVASICVALGAVAVVFITSHEEATIASDFYDPLPKQAASSLTREIPASPAVAAKADRKTLREESEAGGSVSGGGGDPRARVAKEGVLGIVSGKVSGHSVADAGLFGRGGDAENIDDIMQGMGALKSGGSEGKKRRGLAGIGFGAGYGSGLGGGEADALGGITGGQEAAPEEMAARQSPKSETRSKKPAPQPLQTWKRSDIAAHTTKLFVGDHDSLPLKGVQMAVKVDGFRARVVMDCWFFNTYDRQLEGTFKLRLPHDASPYYLAFGETVIMDKDRGRVDFTDYRKKNMKLTADDIRYGRESSWSNVKEARIVPREKAAYAYTETTHRRVDPALMEWAGADIFNCRVFPLRPQQLHRIVIGYDIDLQNMGDDKLLSLPIPQTQSPVCVDVDLAKLDACEPVVSPKKKAFEFDGRLSFHYDNPDAPEITVRYVNPGSLLIAGTADDDRHYWAASCRLALPSEGVRTDEDAVFLVDASLSGNPDKFNVWLRMMKAILENNDDVIKRFCAIFFNVESFQWKEGLIENTKENRDGLIAFASDLALEGATDLGQALSAVKRIPRRAESGSRTVFLLSDGAVTWGERELATLSGRISRGDRVFAYTTGIAGDDTRLLEHLTRLSGGALFTVAGEDQIPVASRSFRNASWCIDEVEMTGGRDALIKGRPRHAFNGQYLTVAGRGDLPQNSVLAVRLSQGSVKRTVTVSFGERLTFPLAPRTYGQIATGELEKFGATAEKYAASYALHFGVPGETCALLMLDSQGDYERYRIDLKSDALAVVSFPVATLLARFDDDNGVGAADTKAAFTQWLRKLEKMPDIGFEISMELDMAVQAIPQSAFSVAAPSLRCAVREKRQLSRAYRIQIEEHSADIDCETVEKEAARRARSSGPHDALKTLSSIVECNPGNTELMRDVGYSIMELGLDAHAYHLFWQVARGRPAEPQTYHALGQALTRMGNADLAAVFYEIALSARWNSRWGEFRRIVGLDYLHLLRMVKRHEQRVNFPEFAEAREAALTRELGSACADLMITITWNTDNTDIDLHVQEPSGEKCFYSHPTTRIGGSLSRDVTQGFGPEMYVLPRAPSGSYKVMVKNFATNQNRTGMRTKIYATVYRHWGQANEKVLRKAVSLEKAKEMNDLWEISI